MSTGGWLAIIWIIWIFIIKPYKEEQQKKREEEIYNQGFRDGYYDKNAEED